MKTEELINRIDTETRHSAVAVLIDDARDRLDGIVKLFREMDSGGWIIDPWKSEQWTALRKLVDGEPAGNDGSAGCACVDRCALMPGETDLDRCPVRGASA